LGLIFFTGKSPCFRQSGIYAMFILYRSGTGQGFEAAFADSADRTAPFFGEIPEAGIFGNFSSFVPFVRVINTSAVHRLTLIHFLRFCHNHSSFL
jgi:hypothetical protein